MKKKVWGIVVVLGVMGSVLGGVTPVRDAVSSVFRSNTSVSIPLQGRWETHAKPGSTIRIRRHERNIVAASFALAKRGYVYLTTDIPDRYLSGVTKMTFRYSGTGADNTIEPELLYNGTNGAVVFGALLKHATNTRGKTRSSPPIPATDFLCWPQTGCTAGDHVDMATVQGVGFLISNKRGDTAGRGKITIESVRGLKG